MSNHNQTLRGDALRMAERFWETGALTDLKRFRNRYHDFGNLLVAGVEAERRTAMGLVLERGRPVLLSERAQGPASVAPVSPKPAGPPVSVDQKSSLRVHDYGSGLDAKNARIAWSTATSPDGRIDIMRSAPSIVYGEVDSVDHDGTFNGNRGVTFIGAYAGSLAARLAAPAANSEARLRVTEYEDNVVYGVAFDPDAEGSLVVVRDERFAVINESGATFSYDGQRSDRALPRRRNFTLSGITLFDVEPDLLEQIVEANVEPNETQPLYGDAANVVGDYVREQDSDVLRPIATRFTVTQQVVPPLAERLA